MDVLKKVGNTAHTQYDIQTKPSLDEIRFDLCRSNSPASTTLTKALNSALIKIYQSSEQSSKKILKNIIRDTLDQENRTAGGITSTFKTIFPPVMKALFQFYLPENGRNEVAVKGNPTDKVKFYIEAASGNTKDAVLTYTAPDRKGRIPVLTISATENTLAENAQPQPTIEPTTAQTPESDRLLNPQLLQQQLFLRELAQVQQEKAREQSDKQSQRVAGGRIPPRPSPSTVPYQGTPSITPTISSTASEEIPQIPPRSSSRKPSGSQANLTQSFSLSSSQHRPYTPPTAPSSMPMPMPNYSPGALASPTQQPALYVRLDYPPPYSPQTPWQNIEKK